MDEADHIQHEQFKLQQEHAEQTRPRPPTQEEITEAIESWNAPERVKNWYRKNPAWAVDANAQRQISEIHHFAKQATGAEEFSDAHIDAMERILFGSAQAAKQSNGHDSERAREPQRPPSPPASPVRQQPQPQRAPQNFAVAAPPSRENFSMSTGRSADAPTRLTAEEMNLAESLGLSHKAYAEQKARMLKLKQSGVIQGDN
jgi:hypothetical protein